MSENENKAPRPPQAMAISEHVRYIRGSGRSTALLFHTLADAVAHPGERISVVDHYASREASLILLDSIIAVAARLDLKLNYSRAERWISTEKRGTQEMQYARR